MNQIERNEGLKQAADGALVEALRAGDKWNPFNSLHEGYAVILEELDELWEEVKEKQHSRDRLRTEALQVAAMAIRFAAELT
jgi:hypothetical protein